MAGMYPDNQMVEIFGEQVLYPGVDPDTGKFTDGDFGDPLKKPSLIPAGTMNLILDNIQNLISGLGLEPNNSDADQLLNAVQTKADIASPALTGTPTAPTAAVTVSNTQIATMAAAHAVAKNDSHPVKSYYTQYPVTGQSSLAGMFPADRSPAALFGGTWTERFTGEQVFFKAGVSALETHRGQDWNGNEWARGEWVQSTVGVEGDAIRNVRGSIMPSLTAEGVRVLMTGGAGAFSPAQDIYGYSISPTTVGPASPSGIAFNSSLIAPTNSRNVPRNRVIKVWERTA